jgi:hypothetical protein
MSLGAYVLPAVFLCLAILLVAQTSITIRSYASTGKAKDTNYYWSVFVLVISIIGLLASFFLMYKASTGVSIVGGANGELLAPVNVVALGTSGNSAAIDSLRTNLATNKGAIETRLNTELATKLAQLEQARKVLGNLTQGAAAGVTTAV